MLSTFLAYISTFYNLMRINFLDWLDVCGFKNDSKIKWVYYTYLGRKYSYPVKKVSRGPVKRDLQLEEFFSNQPQKLEELKGPLGDYHGQLDLIKSFYGLTPPRDNETVYNPFSNMAELLFDSKDSQISNVLEEILKNNHFIDFIDFTVLKYRGLLLDVYNLLDDDLRRIIYHRQASNKLTERIDCREHTESIKQFCNSIQQFIDLLKERKANNENFDFLKEVCDMMGLPESFADLLREYIVNQNFNAELFTKCFADLKTKYPGDPFEGLEKIIEGVSSAKRYDEESLGDTLEQGVAEKRPVSVLNVDLLRTLEDYPSRESTPELDVDSNGNFVRRSKKDE